MELESYYKSKMIEHLNAENDKLKTKGKTEFEILFKKYESLKA